MSREKSDAASVPSRRTVLKGVAGSASLGAVPVASASSDTRRDGETPQQRRERIAAKREVESEYESTDLRAVLASLTGDVLEELVANGRLGSPDLDRFSLGVAEATNVAAAGFATVQDGVGLTSTYEDGTASAHLFAAAETDTGQIHLHVQPELDTAYAVTMTGLSTDSGSVTAAQTECQSCVTNCNHAVYGPIVFGVTGDTDCSDVLTWECTREPTCDECGGQDKCSSGW